ncbi:MAG: Gfo/Idh/MocA family oxidoreductase [Mycobacteriales bacterium]
MRIGIVGIGDIAQKAYLPVLAARADVEPHLVTRNSSVLDRVGAAYRIEHRYTELSELLAVGVDAAFVHTATSAHAETVEQLLSAGVHVYVDKPLDYTYATAERLVAHAERADRSLVVGFNRRYAPAYAELQALPTQIVVMQKNRQQLLERPRTTVFDDFIHVVDTMRFLLPGPVEHVDIRHDVRAGLLHHVVLHLSGAGFSSLGIMSRDSGSVEETLEVIGGGHKRRVVNLEAVIDHHGGQEHRPVPNWQPVAQRRGIEQICSHFLDAVRDGRVLSARDALATHALCEDIAAAAESVGSGP